MAPDMISATRDPSVHQGTMTRAIVQRAWIEPVEPSATMHKECDGEEITDPTPHTMSIDPSYATPGIYITQHLENDYSTPAIDCIVVSIRRAINVCEVVAIERCSNIR